MLNEINISKRKVLSMKGVKLWIVMIIMLLFQPIKVYCFFQGDVIDSEAAKQEIIAQREASEKKYIEYQKQKALEKEQVNQQIILTQNRIEQIEASQGRKNINKQNKTLANKENPQNAGMAPLKSSNKVLYIMLLIAGLIGCVYWIYKLNKNNPDQKG
jgi:hypothetical protein